MKKSVRKWRKGEFDKREYNRRKRDYGTKLNEKKLKEKESKMVDKEKAVKEEREWEVIHRKRGKRKGVNE